MRFLADQCVYRSTIDLLRNLDIDVVTLKDLKAATASDEKVLELAKQAERVLLTNDLDFGQLVFYSLKGHRGVVILRIDPKNETKVHTVLKSFVKDYKGKDALLREAVVIVDRNKYRIRRVSK